MSFNTPNTACSAGMDSSMTLLSIFSTAQLSSPIVAAPTNRPLPFNVWKERRMVVNASELLVSLIHCGKVFSITSISSSASSMKISKTSSSISDSSTTFSAEAWFIGTTTAELTASTGASFGDSSTVVFWSTGAVGCDAAFSTAAVNKSILDWALLRIEVIALLLPSSVPSK